jgi:hypothetical protein
VGSIIGRHLLIVARGCLLACLCRVVHTLLVVGGVLGGDAARLLKRALKEVALSALPQALPTAIGQHAWAVLVWLTMSLGLIAPSLPQPHWGVG